MFGEASNGGQLAGHDIDGEGILHKEDSKSKRSPRTAPHVGEAVDRALILAVN